ncbi:hypothetical protein CKJ70_25940 [Mycobacterium avium]|nr:hypothetical protein CKJ70_25940 [Mycobacterium avium]
MQAEEQEQRQSPPKPAATPQHSTEQQTTAQTPPWEQQQPGRQHSLQSAPPQPPAQRNEHQPQALRRASEPQEPELSHAKSALPWVLATRERRCLRHHCSRRHQSGSRLCQTHLRWCRRQHQALRMSRPRVQ